MYFYNVYMNSSDAGAQPTLGRPPPDEGGRPLPLYEHVKRQLSEAILLGTYPPGAQLPSEIALAQRYGVAVGTMRRALTDLAAEGMLARRRKTGTVVTGRPPHHGLRHFFQYFRLHGADGRLLTSEPEVLRLQRIHAGRADARGLAIAPRSPLIAIHRLRRVAGRPAMHERLVLPAARLSDFPTKPPDVPALLYLHLLERYGIRISAVRETITAKPSSPEDRRLLGLKPQSAVLVIDDVAYDQSGQPVILAHHRATTDRFRYINEIR
jgi:GntR family transcriptional regulator